MANIKLKNRKGVDVSYENISQVSLPNSSGSGTTTFTDTSDANAAAADILASKTAYVNGKKIVGNMPNNTTGGTITSQGGTYTIPAGYTAGGTVTASINAGSATTPATTKQQSAPTFSKSGNVITASVAATSISVTPTVSAGYVSSGTAGTVTMSANSATYTIPTQTKTATANGTISADSGKYLTSVSVSLPEYDGSLSLPAIGGKIFYVDTTASGATYTFYDASMNVITDQTVAGLANAVYYEKSGTSTKDKFYVVGTDSSDTTYGGLKYTTKYWGYYGQTTGATTDSIGSGKSNTDTILAVTDTSSYSDSVFKWIKELRSSKFNGYDDWFIGSKAEQDQLRTSGLTSIYSAKLVWSSVENNSDYAYCWYYYSYWDYYTKYSSYVGLALRAF